MESKTPYYITISGQVREDERLTPNSKLLYGDITSLCNSVGHCWATNAYLAKAAGVDKNTVSKMVSLLEETGYIKTEINRSEDGEIISRFIKLATPVLFSVNTPIPPKGENNSKLLNTKEYSTCVTPLAPQNLVVEKVDWSAAKSDLQKFMGSYIRLQLPEIYSKADKVQVAGFFKQYGKMFSTMLATAGGLDMAMIALDEAKKYYKHLGFPWGLKALYGKWSDFVNEANEVMRRRNAQIK